MKLILLPFISISLFQFLALAATVKNKDLLPNTCGVQDISVDYIYGGVPAELKEFPWMALLEYEKKGEKQFLCGGALINKRYVLTAGHCLYGTWKLVNVILGEHDIRTVKDCKGSVCGPKALNVSIEEKFVHENYSKAGNKEHDFALLRLDTDVNFTDYIKPICLPTTRKLKEESYDDSALAMAGWGYTENGTASPIKIKVELPVVDQTICVNKFKTYRINISDNQMCAGGTVGKDSCTGDSGGALMAKHFDENREIRWYVVGILSFGSKPCGYNVPGVYGRVADHMDWIIGTLRP